MLGSITPLGERGRNSRWGLTIGAFILSSAAAGALLGGLLGAAGEVVGIEGSQVALVLLGAAFVAGLAFDLRLGGLRLPTVHRQVDDRWLYRYRGWVTGVGFGSQLGLGVVTIVTTAFTYVTFVAAGLSGSLAAGALVGGLFGLVRAGTVLFGARVKTPDRLVAMDERLHRWETPTRRGLVAIQAALLAGTAALALGTL